jgi:hypothetical protein
MMQKRCSVPSRAAYGKIMELLLAGILTDLALKLFEDTFIMVIIHDIATIVLYY